MQSHPRRAGQSRGDVVKPWEEDWSIEVGRTQFKTKKGSFQVRVKTNNPNEAARDLTRAKMILHTPSAYSFLVDLWESLRVSPEKIGPHLAEDLEGILLSAGVLKDEDCEAPYEP